MASPGGDFAGAIAVSGHAARGARSRKGSGSGPAGARTGLARGQPQPRPRRGRGARDRRAAPGHERWPLWVRAPCCAAAGPVPTPPLQRPQSRGLLGELGTRARRRREPRSATGPSAFPRASGLTPWDTLCRVQPRPVLAQALGAALDTCIHLLYLGQVFDCHLESHPHEGPCHATSYPWGTFRAHCPARLP